MRKRISPRPDYHWLTPWTILVDETTDKHGWQYAFSFSKKFKAKNKTTKFVRRRKWVRVCSKTPPIDADVRKAHLLQYVHQMVNHSTNALKISNRWRHITEYKRCFIGSDFIDWFVEHLNMTRETALSIGFELMEHNLCQHVTNSQLFRDGRYFYRFTAACNIPKLQEGSSSLSSTGLRLGLQVGDIVYTHTLDSVHLQYNNKVGKIVEPDPKKPQTAGHFAVKFRMSNLPPKSISSRNLTLLPHVDEILLDAFLELNVELSCLEAFAQSDLHYDDLDLEDVSDYEWKQLIPIAGQRSRFKQWVKNSKDEKKTDLADKLEELSKMPPSHGARKVTIISCAKLDDITPVSRGGHFGILFLAKYRPSSAPVLLKIAHELKTRNWEEYQNLKTLPLHPNILTQLGLVLDFPHNNKLNPAIMYPIDNHLSVFQAVQIYREDMYRLGKSLVLRLSLDLAEALRIFHSHDIIHRDVGLRNCLLSHKQVDHEDQRAKLSEFGLCRKLEKPVYYTPPRERLAWRWTAPETIANGECSKSSDVFMFGIALWEFLGVTPPFLDCSTQSEKLELLRESHSKDENVVPLQTSKWFPKAFWELIQKCCHFDAEKRPTIEMVIQMLREIPQSDGYETHEIEEIEDPLKMYDIEYSARNCELKDNPEIDGDGESDGEEGETALYDRLEIELEYTPPLQSEFDESKESDPDQEISYQSSISDGSGSFAAGGGKATP